MGPLTCDTSLELKDQGEHPQNDDLQHQIRYFSCTFQIQFEFKTQESFNCTLVQVLQNVQFTC